MKRLLYVSFENSENQASGVNKKINSQIRVFKAAGFSTDLIAKYQDNIAFYQGDLEKQVVKAVVPWRIALCRWAAERACEYDLAYIRFQFFCPFVLNMVRAFYKKNRKVVMEIPTYPYVPELRKQGSRGIPKLLIDRSFQKMCAKYIDRFAVPLYGNPILGKTCIEIRNGIEVDEIPARKLKQNDERIHLLAVAMMAPWHGYDRAIEGLHLFYSNGGAKDIVLHLVGQGTASDGYSELIEKYGLGDHVIQHGKMHGEALDAIYDIADIGVGSLGIHRTQIKKTNTLKIMEYMAKGIPVICEQSECGIPIDNPYRMTVANDDSPIDIAEVIRFYEAIYSARNLVEIVDDIREECRRNCNVEAGMKKVLDFMMQ